MKLTTCLFFLACPLLYGQSGTHTILLKDSLYSELGKRPLTHLSDDGLVIINFRGGKDGELTPMLSFAPDVVELPVFQPNGFIPFYNPLFTRIISKNSLLTTRNGKMVVHTFTDAGLVTDEEVLMEMSDKKMSNMPKMTHAGFEQAYDAKRKNYFGVFVSEEKNCQVGSYSVEQKKFNNSFVFSSPMSQYEQIDGSKKLNLVGKDNQMLIVSNMFSAEMSAFDSQTGELIASFGQPLEAAQDFSKYQFKNFKLTCVESEIYTHTFYDRQANVLIRVVGQAIENTCDLDDTPPSKSALRKAKKSGSAALGTCYPVSLQTVCVNNLYNEKPLYAQYYDLSNGFELVKTVHLPLKNGEGIVAMTSEYLITFYTDSEIVGMKKNKFQYEHEARIYRYQINALEQK